MSASSWGVGKPGEGAAARERLAEGRVRQLGALLGPRVEPGLLDSKEACWAASTSS